MKILVVDDEQRFGALICRSLRKLGHEPMLALHPDDALTLLRAHPDLEAVISDLDMPVMNGVELANAIRAQRDDLPIAFCTGSSPRHSVLSDAAAIGKVLTAPWTLNDMDSLVGHLERTRRPAAPRRAARVQLHSWDEVLRLCDRRDRGPVRLTTQGSSADDGPVAVTVAMPGGFSLVVDGEVVARKILPGSDALEIIVELSGLSPELTTRLRALAAPAKRSAPPPPDPISELSRAKARLERVAAGTPSPDLIDEWQEPGWERELARASGGMKVSELLLSNERLKVQIEALAAKMRPRPGGGGDGEDSDS
jgi:CheY-like chemotaxis protein